MEPNQQPQPDVEEATLPRGVTDGGPWRGPDMKEWVERIASPATPIRESLPWIKHYEETIIEKGR